MQATIFPNQAFSPEYRPGESGRAPLQFHSRLAGYAPTPLHDLSRLAQQLGLAQLLIKDESHRLGLPAFKILGASWAAYAAISERFGISFDAWQSPEELARLIGEREQLTLFSATDGNHGRAVARVARIFGLRAKIDVPKGTARARIAAIESEGASVTIVDGTYDDAVAKAADDAERLEGLLIQDNSWEGYERIPRKIIEGYSTLLWEIDDERRTRTIDEPTHVFVQLGNGSFADAVVRHYRTKQENAVIIGVEPASAACVLESVRAGKRVRVSGPFTSIMVGMNCDSPSRISFPVLQSGMNAFVALADEWATKAVREFHRQGIASGETGAAGLGALLAVFHEDDARDVLGISNTSRMLVFSTEGATNPELYESILRGEC